MIHLYRPTNRLIGVIVEPSIIAEQEIKTFMAKRQISDWAQLMGLIWGNPDLDELRKPEGLVATRWADRQGFVTIINSNLFRTLISQPTNFCSRMHIGNVYGATFWNCLYEYSQGYRQATKNTAFAGRILAAADETKHKFKVNIDLAPALQGIAPLLEGLGEPIVWGREAGEELDR